jgi:hypothetical protein
MSDLFVKDLDGKDVTLAEIAKDKPTLFIFVRHFG